MGPRSRIFEGGQLTWAQKPSIRKVYRTKQSSREQHRAERGQGRQELEIREILIGLEHLQYLTNTGSEKKKKSPVNKQNQKKKKKSREGDVFILLTF